MIDTPTSASSQKEEAVESAFDGDFEPIAPHALQANATTIGLAGPQDYPTLAEVLAALQSQAHTQLQGGDESASQRALPNPWGHAAPLTLFMREDTDSDSDFGSGPDSNNDGGSEEEEISPALLAAVAKPISSSALAPTPISASTPGSNAGISGAGGLPVPGGSGSSPPPPTPIPMPMPMSGPGQQLTPDRTIFIYPEDGPGPFVYPQMASVHLFPTSTMKPAVKPGFTSLTMPYAEVQKLRQKGKKFCIENGQLGVMEPTLQEKAQNALAEINASQAIYNAWGAFGEFPPPEVTAYMKALRALAEGGPVAGSQGELKDLPAMPSALEDALTQSGVESFS